MPTEDVDLGVVVDQNAEKLILIDEKGNRLDDRCFTALLTLLVFSLTKAHHGRTGLCFPSH